MRGKVTLQDVPCDSVGITPACAGKRKKCRKCRPGLGDHPRMCGEKKFTFDAGKLIPGSPPRMRGKAAGHRLGLILNRITPAYAGKRLPIRVIHSEPGDHPRMCGEKQKDTHAAKEAKGSPPRMRRKVAYVLDFFQHVGITPAYAGKRLKRSRSTVPPVAIVPLFPSVCNKPVASDGSPAGRDAPLFLPAENAVPASPAYNLRSL